MKKYAIIIGENNEKVSRQVQEALFAVGFKWETEEYGVVEETRRKFLGVNVSTDGRITYSSAGDSGDIEALVNECGGGKTFLWPSYVIAHAAELDGARKPWEIAPEGYRLVTDEERSKYKQVGKSEGKYYNSNTNKWSVAFIGEDYYGWDVEISGVEAYAVPVDFTFAPPEKEIEVGGKMYSESTLKNALREYVG